MFKFSKAFQSPKKKNLTKQKKKTYLKFGCLLLNGLQDWWVPLPLFFCLQKTKHKRSHFLWTYLFIFFHTHYPSKKGDPIFMFIIPKVFSPWPLLEFIVSISYGMKQLSSSKIKLHKHNIYLIFYIINNVLHVKNISLCIHLFPFLGRNWFTVSLWTSQFPSHLEMFWRY
jgi:hypothetical protein